MVPRLLEEAVAMHQAGNFAEAYLGYEMVLVSAPKNADALHLMGVLAHQQGDPATAIEFITRAIEINDGVADFHLNLGTARLANGRITEAIASLHRSIELNPKSAIAHNNLGNAYRDLGDLSLAAQSLRIALEINPNYAEALSNQGAVLRELGDLSNAKSSLSKAIMLQPELSDAHNNLGLVFARQDQPDEAIAAYCEALRIKPNQSETWCNLANLCKRVGLPQAKAAYDQLSRLRSDPIWTLGPALLCPVISESMEQIDEYRTNLRQAIDRMRGVQLVENPHQLHKISFEPPFTLAYQGKNDVEIKSAYADLYSGLFDEIRQRSRERKPASGKIRVGFFVAERREVVFLRFMAGLINQLDREQLEIFVIHQRGHCEKLRQKLNHKRVNFCVVSDLLDNPSVAALDVLMFFEIGAEQVSYFLPFHCLAPVQCTTWGIPVTSGLPDMDHFVSSKLLEPESSLSHYREQLTTFDTLPVYYERPTMDFKLRDREYFGFTASENLYVCPQNLIKFHPEFDLSIAEILRRDPRGKLVLIDGMYLHWRNSLVERMRTSMPDVVDRIVILPRLAKSEFYSLLQVADVMLDTFPFGGGATTYEALSLGTPIVTQPSQYMRGRVTSACFQRMQHTYCVADSSQSYISKALQIAQDRDMQQSLRADIRDASAILFEDKTAVFEFHEFLVNEGQRSRKE